MSGPGWLDAADRALALAIEQVKLIRAVTPRNADAELAALERDYRAGQPRLPRWQYDRPELKPDLLRALPQVADHLEALATPLAAIYAARARELALEAAIVDAVGSGRGAILAERASARFLGTSPVDRALSGKAHALALAWARADDTLRDPCSEHDRARVRERRRDPALVRSCDADHPESLVVAMAREVGRAHLPLRVIVQPGLASLAATGEGFILVAADRWLTPRATARTVLHEIAGHALPRARAAAESLRIYALGTARGVDDQEGRALLIERAAGFLDGERRRELAWRHIGAEAALAGATFVDTVEELTRRLAAPLVDALRIATRVHRGGDGVGGLGREVVYLTSLLRVERALGADPTGVVERVMSSGRVAADLALVVDEVGKHQARGEHHRRRFGPSSTV